MKTPSLIILFGVAIACAKTQTPNQPKLKPQRIAYVALDDRPPFRVTQNGEPGYSAELIEKKPLEPAERTVGPLSFGEIRDAIYSSTDFNASCGSATDHDGWAVLDFTIEKNGLVRDIRTRSVRSVDGVGEDCIVNVLQGMHFPERDNETLATFPFQIRGPANAPQSMSPSRDATRASAPPPLDVASPPADASRQPDGLTSKLLQSGNGDRHPQPDDTVFVNYVCWSPDGTTLDRGQHARLILKRIIPGWSEAIGLMAVGEKRRVWIPQRLAFNGSAPTGTLVFDLELLQIKNWGRP